MRILSVGLLAGLIFINALLPFSWAGDNPMFDFYNGLTEVIEKNMNNPDTCAKQAESYIKNNIVKLQKAAEAGKKNARKNTKKYEDMSQAELDSAMKEAERAMSDPKIAESMNASMAAMNRFIEVIDTFAMKHPAEGEKIMEALSQYSPQK